MGSNPAENHPISFKWVLKAQDKGAKVVSVDPRFTHSSSKADFYVQLRVGTDIAFLGGMINYILNNDKYFKQYVIDSTNGPPRSSASGSGSATASSPASTPTRRATIRKRGRSK